MPTATITPKYVDAPKPGKKNATIKDTTDKLWLIPPADQAKFTIGATYEVIYEEFDFKGTTFRNIKTNKQTAAAPVGAVHSGGYSNPQKDEQIAVLAMLKPWMDKIPVGDTGAVIHAIQSLRDAWAYTFGSKKPSSKIETGGHDDLNDEIPEFR